ncbi:SWI/SNF and RSC complex subunit Ssr2 [Malassezia psittaci]|uniref:SWI/SNF and RSC complex subunit Ssr2 n=1 Tax=Malassezia psittaci TaxID=1821823 RepID=A0AAF0FD08_9BASI|nr:SWI/SNF and RSC complex subunit Ssr2 [Malassezia psittaci]
MSLNVNGFPDQGLLHDESVWSRLSPLVDPLVSSLKEKSLSVASLHDVLDAKQLAQFVYDLACFQEKVLGVSSKKPANPQGSSAWEKHPLRLPASVLLTHPSLTDFSALNTDAPLFAVLKAAFTYIAEHHQTSWDFSNESQQKFYVEMVASIRRSLQSSEILPEIRIAPASDLAEAEIDSLRIIAQELGCKFHFPLTITGQWTDATNATHILKSSHESITDLSSSSSKPPESEYFRAVSHHKSKVLIHVWYRPDSYDTWLPDKDFAEPEPAPAPKSSAWQISARWLRDSALYNELMNEEDYEQDDDQDLTQTPTPDTVRSRKHNLPESITDDAANKRVKLLVENPLGATPIDLSGAHSIPGKKYESEPIASGTLGNLPQESSLNPSATPADASTVPVRAASVSDTQSADVVGSSTESDHHPLDSDEVADTARKYLSEQTQEVIIPSYSTWFDMAHIHAIERRSLPEFFNNKNRSKTPTIYKNYRDFMINTYRLNPSEYLTFTACRRNLAGDVCAIMRVHAFLEQWGLINYQIDPETRPASLGPPFTGHFRVLIDTPRGLAPLHPGTKPENLSSQTTINASTPTNSQNAAPHNVKSEGEGNDLTLELRRSVFQSTLKGSRPVDYAEANSLAAAAQKELDHAESKPGYACDTCGVDCSASRYQSTRVKDFGLCPNCYLEGRFPTSMYSGDFVRLEDTPFKQAGNVNGQSADDWTDQETLKLLEGLEMHEEDWDAIASHVGTRSREQCIIKFIQLPIQDKYLDGASQSDLGALQYAPRDATGKHTPLVPFAQGENPVMSVVALLASAVSPAVAAAAAQSALGELTDGIKKRIQQAAAEGGKDSDANPSPSQEKQAEQQDDSMQVDSDPNAKQADAQPKRSDSPSASEAPQQHKDPSSDMQQEESAAPSSSQPPEAAQEAASDQSASSNAVTQLPKSDVERAASVALGAAASKAYVLASYEERECQRLVQQIIEAQLKKMQLKMTQFQELESLLETERRSIEAGRKQLYADRLAVQRQLAAVNDLLRKASTTPNEVRPEDLANAQSGSQGVPQQGPIVRQGPPASATPPSGTLGRLG